MKSGYTQCKCRDCMEVAISNDVETSAFCSECSEAGCEQGKECSVPNAYGTESA